MTTGIIFILIIFSAVLLNFILPVGVKSIHRAKCLANAKRSKCIYLTFDDGPNPDSTPQILESLRKAGVKATFFPSGESAIEHPDIIEQILNDGHGIGEHSYSHKNALRSTPWSIWCDLRKGSEVLKRYAGAQKRMTLRPPYGKLNIASLIYILLFKRPLVFWDIDPKDYIQNSAEHVSAKVINELKTGSIILLHDGRRNSNDNLEVTINAVRMIVDHAKKEGLQFATIDRVFSQ